MILIGISEPEGGWLLEEIEAALYQAETMGLIMPKGQFVTSVGKRAEAAYLEGLL